MKENGCIGIVTGIDPGQWGIYDSQTWFLGILSQPQPQSPFAVLETWMYYGYSPRALVYPTSPELPSST